MASRRSGMVRKRHTTKIPRANSTTDITGAAASPERVSTCAPKNAAMPPGRAMNATTRQSMFPNFQWDTPEASVVPTSAKCTVAETVAGAKPTARSSVDEVTP